jgi:hypothetical protein
METGMLKTEKLKKPFIILITLASILMSVNVFAAPLEFTPFSAIRTEVFFSRMMGRMGFGVTQTGVGSQTGSLADFRTDLGLPGDNRTWRLTALVRPFEHHLLRVYGAAPEHYSATKVIARDIVTRNTTYTQGTPLSSEVNTAQFGFGYDLDFAVGPRWFGGINSDIRYLHLKGSMSSPETGLGDTITISEAIPCLGAHMEARLPERIGWIQSPISMAAGARMTYGINPDFANYINISMGVSSNLRFRTGLLLDTRVGYQFESFNWSQTIDTGRAMEMERDGIFLSVAAIF